jgi:hypothetical protein
MLGRAISPAFVGHGKLSDWIHYLTNDQQRKLPRIEGAFVHRRVNPPHLIHSNLVVRMVSPSFRTLKPSGIRSTRRVPAVCMKG